ncbi:MAG: flagellar motor switch protein FliG, partial [Myxococcota bacterium]
VGDEGPVTLNGTDMAVKLLKSVGSLDEQLILNALDELDTDLTETIRSKLFTFEDVLQLHDREIQMVMREVDQRSLPMALKTASTELADKLLSNVSSRAAAMLRDDMQALGPVTIAQVEEAQQGIVSQIMALAAEGRVNLRPGDTV